MMKNKVKQTLSIVDSILALVCLALAARSAEPMSTRAQICMVIIGFLGVFFAVILCLVFSQKRA